MKTLPSLGRNSDVHIEIYLADKSVANDFVSLQGQRERCFPQRRVLRNNIYNVLLPHWHFRISFS